jgi:hypothetical protein
LSIVALLLEIVGAVLMIVEGKGGGIIQPIRYKIPAK